MAGPEIEAGGETDIIEQLKQGTEENRSGLPMVLV